MKVLNIYKPTSVTPYQLIKKLRTKFPEIFDKKIAYAGRLDPMASGVMLYLVGDEVKNRDKYQKLSKTYKTTLVFGLQTDTYDPMGVITSIDKSADIEKYKKVSHRFCLEKIGLQLQKYPPFSSKTINGKPMYKLSLTGELDEDTIPEKEVFIYKANINNFRIVNFNQLKSDFIKKINKVKGDFRQEKIIKQYKDLEDFEIIIADALFEVSSGTYIRSIANDLGAIAYDISRIKAGEHLLRDSIKL